jgi:predicted esterase
MSPGSNFGRLHCNVLLEQGTADSIVPPHASIVASKELSASGATVRLTMVPGADHDLSQAVWGPGLAEGTSFLLQNL